MKFDSGLRRNIRKYLHYAFDWRGLDTLNGEVVISEQALETSRQLRGCERPPAIMLHGITQRCGSVYVGQLLALHPDILSYPNEIWEVPFLPLTGKVLNMQEHFFLHYEMNRSRIGDQDFLPLFGNALLAYLNQKVPAGQRLHVKMPSVEYLNYFYSVFPYEHLLVVVRDGRDVVASTVRTWPQIPFHDACRRWARSARMVLACHTRYDARPGYMLVNYENAVHKPEELVADLCREFHLDASRYPFDKIDSLPVIGSSTTRNTGNQWQRKTKDFQPIGRWKNWSALKKFVFKRIAGQALIDLKYAENMDW